MIANVCVSTQAEGLDFLRPTTADFAEKTVLIMPLFHAFGSLVTAVPTLREGGSLVTLPNTGRIFCATEGDNRSTLMDRFIGKKKP